MDSFEDMLEAIFMMVVIGSPRARLRFLVVLATLVVAIGVLERSMVTGVQSVLRMATGRILPVYCVETDRKEIAISFDATWGSDTTEGLLDILDEAKVKTTFFLAGYWLEKYPDMVREITRRGHELGNHSYSHPHFNSLSASEMRHELEQTHALIQGISGQESTLFRPPFGEYNNTVVTTAKECGYETIMWDVDSLDWKDLTSDEIVRRVMSRVKAGSIVLFHNAGRNTGPAVRTIIRTLKSEGFDIVPISRILLKGDTYIDHTGRQCRRKTAESAPAKDAPASARWSSDPWSHDEGGPAFDAVQAVVAQGISKVVTEAGYEAHYRGNADKKRVAFAMNVAWGEEHIPGILRVLEGKDAKITFYFVGTWVRMFPELTQEIAGKGHEIANHGYTHAHPTRIPQSELEGMITKNRELLEATVGDKVSKLFSPPYGEIDDRVIDTAGRLGMVTTMWTADTIDWQRPAPSVIVDRIMGKADNGSIILMHPTAPTLQALPNLIDGLRDKGYDVVPVGEILR